MLTFKPVKPRHLAGRSALMIARVEGKGNNRDGIRLSINRNVLKDLRWMNGDRLVVRYDDKADAWFIERVPSAGAGDGYKLVISEAGGANASGYVRVSVDRAFLDSIVPEASPQKSYDFLESTGNVASFVIKE